MVVLLSDGQLAAINNILKSIRLWCLQTLKACRAPIGNNGKDDEVKRNILLVETYAKLVDRLQEHVTRLVAENSIENTGALSGFCSLCRDVKLPGASDGGQFFRFVHTLVNGRMEWWNKVEYFYFYFFFLKKITSAECRLSSVGRASV